MTHTHARAALAAMLTLVFLAAHNGAAAELDEIVKNVQAAFDKTRFMTATFTQTVKSKGFGREMVSTGVMYLSKPLKMRWEYHEPSKLLLVVDGERLWSYDPEENIVYYDTLTGFLHPKSPALFLAGEEPLKNLFNIELAPARKEDTLNTISLRLFPKEPQPGVKAMLMTVDSKTFGIVETIVVDYLGNRSRITFTNVDRATEPETSLFTFTPPPGARVRRIPAPQRGQ